MSQTNTYTVSGMHCGHCVASVSEEVQEIAGVEDVDVVLETGALTVTAPLARSTPTSVTPATCETSSVTEDTQWAQVMPVTV